MIILGLGTNMGDRAAQLRMALAWLREKMDVVTVSPVYETPALLLPDSPKEWNVPFYNMAAIVKTDLVPEALLLQIKSIESDMGRGNSQRWSPRPIDIDILAYDDAHVSNPKLTIPHEALLKRDFALVPLAAIAPEWKYPLAGEYCNKTARELCVLLGFGEGQTLRRLNTEELT